MRHFALLAGAGGLALLLSVPAKATPAEGIADAQRIARLEAELRAQNARIAELESTVRRLTSGPPTAAAVPSVTAPPASISAPSLAAAPATSAPAAHAPTVAQLQVAERPLTVGGDLRVRHETNFAAAAVPRRDRATVRARLRADYRLSDAIAIGAQLATGDPDDPNSTDVTLSNFADDFQVSLEQAFVRARAGGAEGFAGKFPLPFLRTDLVWDSDVSPQGVSLAYGGGSPTSLNWRVSGLYFIVDESVAGADSRMLGGQARLTLPLAGPIGLEFAGGYYDYRLTSLAGADGGDLGSNLIGPDGRYLSDFDLFDVILVASHSGLFGLGPVRLGFNYVQNLGAATNEDSGLALDLQLGRLSRAGDFRWSYGFAEAETDAVLAAFSHDNTMLATNYRQHSLSVDFALRPDLFLNGTFYRYRTLESSALVDDVWFNRLRLQLLMQF